MSHAEDDAPRGHCPESRTHRLAPPALQRYDICKKRIDALDRRIDEDDLAWLRLSLDGSGPPPPRQPRHTTFAEPAGWHGRPECEPAPFHAGWLALGMVLWATIWLSLYVGSALWLHH